MNKIDMLRMTSKNFIRRKVRTFLTVLGVVIGTAAIVVMLSLGIGVNESFKAQLEKMGSLNMITVNPNYVEEEAGGRAVVSTSRAAALDDKTIEKLSLIEGVEAVTPIIQTTLRFVSGKYVSYVNVMGIDPGAMSRMDFKIAQGRLLKAGDTNTVVFGSSIGYSFTDTKSSSRTKIYYRPGSGTPPVDVLNDRMIMTFDMTYGERRPSSGSAGQIPGLTGQARVASPKLYKVNGVGLLEETQNENSYVAFMNIHYLKKLMKENNKSLSGQAARTSASASGQGYQQAKVKVKDIKDVDRIQEEIKAMKLGAYSLGDISQEMQKTMGILQAILGGIGAISLFVAAIGITNTMVMSIYERTREIGVMKVLGCVLGDIRRLFLMEAGMIGFAGGIIGLLFSFGASFLLNIIGAGFINSAGGGGQNSEPATISIIPLWLALASIGFATFVGLVSGYYPARRAMKLSALEAIRTE